MREKLKKIVAYIFRSWEDEPGSTPTRLKILPPFLLELLSYLMGLAILYQIGAYLWSII
jgi:hypothetical protein